MSLACASPAEQRCGAVPSSPVAPAAAAGSAPAIPTRGVDELLGVARSLDVPSPHERKDVLRSEAGILLDAVITRAARGSGALEIAIGEGLAALATGNRVERLGYTNIGDYAFTVLGIAASTAAKMERRARYLRDRPLLRDAVWVGEVEPSKADVVMKVAQGDSEAAWVERAKVQPVRALREEVKQAGVEVEDEDNGERWERVLIPLDAEGRAEFDEAVGIARKILGATTPKWNCLLAQLQEFASAHPYLLEDGKDVVLREAVEQWVEGVKKHFEEETDQWAFFERAAPEVAPVPSVPVTEDPWLLDPELRRLNAERNRFDEALGRAAMIFRSLGLWRDARFTSFAHYCSERARMSVRAIEQRIALERRLEALALLRQELREGRITYEKARLVAREADERTEAQWIAYADTKTCIELRRELDGDLPPRPPDLAAQMLARARTAAQAAPDGVTEAGAQMSASLPSMPPRSPAAQMLARPDLDLRMPVHVRELLEAVIRGIRKAAGKLIGLGECLRFVWRHFIDTWKAAVQERNTVRNRALERDRGFCTVPGCSLAAGQGHHVEYKSHGGSDGEKNRASLCIGHHLHGVHAGKIRMYGTAPDHLVFELVERPGTLLGPRGPERLAQGPDFSPSASARPSLLLRR